MLSDMALLRIGILAVGLVLIAAIVFFGGAKTSTESSLKNGTLDDPSRFPNPLSQGRKEPVLDPVKESVSSVKTMPDPPSAPLTTHRVSLVNTNNQKPITATQVHSSYESHSAVHIVTPPPPKPVIPPNLLGKRPNNEFDKIIRLYVAAKVGYSLRGEDIVVAAEKTGLVFGYMNVFHRMLDGHPELGPVFSMANIMNPGNFDMAAIREMETPAIAFFLTLPAPTSALDGWEKMLPTVQRISELLDAVVLDEDRNPLARQRIAHIRDELRAYDREKEQKEQSTPVNKSNRWG